MKIGCRWNAEKISHPSHLCARTCSSSVAPPIVKILKGDLEAMPRVTQKQRNWTPKSARCTHCVPLAREIKNWRDLDFRSNFPFFCVCILSDFRPISTPETRLYWPSVTIKTVKKNKTYCNFDILLFIFSCGGLPLFQPLWKTLSDLERLSTRLDD